MMFQEIISQAGQTLSFWSLMFLKHMLNKINYYHFKDNVMFNKTQKIIRKFQSYKI